ncbi:MAG: VOC family protein [Bdellovibrionales bacterium]|nr:VOC family protein [Bdellovibrionales bacterium]
MKKNSVGWFEIYVNDMKRAKNFYEIVFQKQLEELKSPEDHLEMWLFPGDMESYGANGALVKMEGFSVSGQNSVLIYFSCKDCSVEEKRVSESGGRVEKSKFSIGQYGFISLVYDTEGNMIGLHSME